jgi:hypothetical protein
LLVVSVWYSAGNFYRAFPEASIDFRVSREDGSTSYIGEARRMLWGLPSVSKLLVGRDVAGILLRVIADWRNHDYNVYNQ